MPDSRHLYFGLRPERYRLANPGIRIDHCPLVKPKAVELDNPDLQQAISHWPRYDYIVFTSQTAVEVFYAMLDRFRPGWTGDDKTAIAVGTATAQALSTVGWKEVLLAQPQQAEGVVDTLQSLSLGNHPVLWPRAAGARNLISEYLREVGADYFSPVIYDIVELIPSPLPDLNAFSDFIFTSPSVVRAYVQAFGAKAPPGSIWTIGPITSKVASQIGWTNIHDSSNPSL